MALAHVRVIQESQIERICQSCHVVIQKRAPYRTWRTGYRDSAVRHVRCMQDKCTPKGYELEQNDKLADLLRAQAELDAAGETSTAGDAADLIEGAAGIVREVALAFNAYAGTPLEGTDQGQRWAEHVTTLEGFAVDLERIAGSLYDLANVDAEPDDYDDRFVALLAEVEEVPSVEL